MNYKEQTKYVDVLGAISEIIDSKCGVRLAIAQLVFEGTMTVEQGEAAKERVNSTYDEEIADLKPTYLRLQSKFEARTGRDLPELDVFN